MKRSPVALLGAAALVAGSALFSSPAAAGGHGQPGSPRTVADGLLTPLKLAVSQHGRMYVSQNFAGELTRILPNGTKTPVVTVPGEEVGGVSEHRGTVYWTTTGEGSAKVFAQRPGRGPQQIADLFAYESTRNPDARTTYGFRDLPQACAAQFPASSPASYTGIVESHPYATLPAGRRTLVADAAANAIFSVGPRGQVRTLATLPAVGTVATAEALQAQGMPACAAGHTYYFEFVPTDIERGRDGSLYVTSLPGGPEDASLGARGGVFKIDPRSGQARKVAGGFVGAVDLALLPDGRIAVAELFGGADGAGQVTMVRPRSSYRRTLDLASPAAVEWKGSRRHGSLYVTTDTFTGGEPAPVGKVQVLSFGSHRKHHHRR
ncbi:ScyD/ScyE family protein [Aeromicrobium chenweiae]|uniref:ScyD/ScyE family protein n=1 Tax=Aeromicrobium chenweiae TaxID=2079793 RepID=A0A2S0WI30_9ACTN|nr:ScyD/ScyE family protein [Aeromicrobium chenweiae]AWB90890.1 ScyD/ScyE family protein [Aeromicrobium chenweiae]TGN32108.1 ScyD/ScyE family protein [Aeromicrobium chenweiae]